MVNLKPRKSARKIKRGDFTIGKFREECLHAKGLKFARLYDDNRVIVRYFIAGLIGVLSGAFVQLLIKNTGLYNTGMSAIVQGLARLTNTILLLKNTDPDTVKLVYNLMFWVFYFLINIPLVILCYCKIGKLFTKLTLIFLLCNTLTGFGLSYIPGIETVLIFGSTRPSYFIPDLKDPTNIIDNYLYKNCGISLIPFWFNGEMPTMITVNKIQYIIYNPDYDPFKSLFCLFYGVAYGFSVAVMYSVLYIIGGSSGGMDFVSFYFSVKKQKAINNLLVIINFISMTSGVVLGSYIPAGIAVPKYCWGYQWFLSSNFVSSFIMILVFKFTLSRFYPSTQQCKVEIYTTKGSNIVENLMRSGYIRSLSSSRVIGSYSKQEREVLWTICYYNELPRLIYHIREEDTTCLISASLIRDIDGVIKVYQQGSIAE